MARAGLDGGDKSASPRIRASKKVDDHQEGARASARERARTGGLVTISDTDLSWAVSHALRHGPWLYEIELDEEGWTPVDQLRQALREKGRGWESVDRASLERMLAAHVPAR